MSSRREERISLYYKDGRSDKEYRTQLEPRGDGFIVNFQFGRRGTTLQSGTKTESPVRYETAKEIYDKLVAEKKAKGYVEGQEGTSYQEIPVAGKQSGLLPQLLNSIDSSNVVQLIEDDRWMMQEKKDASAFSIYANTMRWQRLLG